MTDPATGSGDPHRHPIHARATLRQLSGTAGRIWREAEARRAGLVAIVQALDGTDAALLQATVRHMDDAVAAGLHAFGFPRGPIQGVQIERSPTMWAGRKDPACMLVLSADALRRNLSYGRPDAVFRTWVHESLHARQLYAIGHADEYRRAPGYEEGFVEGLARELLSAAGGFVAIGGSFDYYVTAWHALAHVLSIPAYTLWQRIWAEPPGRVRAGFTTVVNDLRRRGGMPALTDNGLARLEGIADTLFNPTRASAVPDMTMIERTWRLVPL
jgi:hypothetical protein